MNTITINTLYEEIQTNFPHGEYLKNRLIYRMGEVFKLNQLHGESYSLVRNGGSDYSLAHVPERLLIAGISGFLENELGLTEGEYLDKLQKGIQARVTSIIGKGFDVENSKSVGEEELKQILGYTFTGANIKPFFIIGSDTLQEKTGFNFDITNEMPKENWYMLVNPIGTSHIILTNQGQWIRLNGRGQLSITECNGDAWSYGGGTFQSDKFTSRNHVIYSTILPDEVQNIFQEINT